jgi:hypothetical protein
MQAPHFFEESGHSHAFAEGNLHMKGVLMKYHTHTRCCCGVVRVSWQMHSWPLD